MPLFGLFKSQAGDTKMQEEEEKKIDGGYHLVAAQHYCTR